MRNHSNTTQPYPEVATPRSDELERALTAIGELPTIEAQLVAWMDLTASLGLKRIRNMWLMEDGTHIYVRYSERFLLRSVVRCLDIAHAQMEETLHGKGRFTAFVRFAAAINPWDAIYFEHVGNPWLLSSFRRRGYYEDVNFRSRNFYYFTDKSAEARVLR